MSLLHRRFQLACGVSRVAFEIVAVEPDRVQCRLLAPHDPVESWLSVDLLADALEHGEIRELDADSSRQRRRRSKRIATFTARTSSDNVFV